MKLKAILTSTIILTFLNIGFVRAQIDSVKITPSHLAAAKQLMLTTGMTDVRFTLMRDNTVKALSASIPTNNKEKLTISLKAFFDKYLPHDRFIEQFAQLYAEIFTEDELNQLIKFYKSPLGKKVALRLPEVLQKGMLIDQQILMEHTAELQSIAEKSAN